MPANPSLLVALDLRGRLALVVGGGQVGRRKIARLLDARASVRLVSPDDPDLGAWLDGLDGPRPQWRAGRFEPADLDGCALAFACADDPEVNRALAEEAAARGLWCNVSDGSAPGDLTLLSRLDLGALAIGIASGGLAPGVSRLLREHLESSLGAPWIELTEAAEALRAALKEREPEGRRRAELLRGWLGAPTLRALAEGDRAAWARIAADHLGPDADPIAAHLGPDADPISAHLGTDADPIAAHLGSDADPIAPRLDGAARGAADRLSADDAPAPVEEAERRPVVVLSGFGPFPGVSRNPSPVVAQAARGLLEERRPGVEVRVVELPTLFDGAWARLKAELDAIEADKSLILKGIFSLGVAGGSTAVRIERVAVNHRRGERPDASGRCAPMGGGPILPQGPDGLMARLPVDAIVGALAGRGQAVIASESAGLYVCNEVFYRLMVWCNAARFGGRAGFIHIPQVPEDMGEREAGEAVAGAVALALALGWPG